MNRTSIFRSLSVGMLACITLLAGCSTDNTIAFTNVSESALNVEFFVLDASMPSDSATTFVSNDRMQVAPGQTVEYALSMSAQYEGSDDTLIHMHVEPVTPSWDTDPCEYWLEMLTMPPVTIVATGSPDALSFDAGNGAVAIIPSNELQKGRFEHASYATADESEGSN
ncbi:MAG: hypothetical protein ACYTGR_01580 [Planctomycetota bacterium]|jgi:hypothetical protein